MKKISEFIHELKQIKILDQFLLNLEPYCERSYVSHFINGITIEFSLEYSHENKVIDKETRTQPEYSVDIFTLDNISEITLYKKDEAIDCLVSDINEITEILNKALLDKIITI